MRTFINTVVGILKAVIEIFGWIAVSIVAGVILVYLGLFFFVLYLEFIN